MAPLNAFLTAFCHVSRAALVLLIVIIIKKTVKWYFSPLRKIPGPKNLSFVVGAFLEIAKEPFMEPHKRWWKELGENVPMIHYTSAFGRSSLVILDKDIVKTILTSPAGQNPSRFPKEPIITLQNTIGNGLVSLEGPDWSRHRQIIQPSFSQAFLKESLERVVPEKVDRFIQAWQRAGNEREIDVASHLSALTLDVVGQVAFSHDFHGIELVEAWSSATDDRVKLAKLDDPFLQALMTSIRLSRFSFVMAILGLGTLDSWLNPRIRQTRALLNEAADQVVVNASRDDNGSKSLLQLMLVAQDPQSKTGKSLNHVELRDETKTFMIAGHETTSTWCYFCLYTLALYPDVQERLYQDIVSHATDGSISLQDVNKMEYLNAFLQEVLRLYSPVGMITRQNSHEENFAGYRIPAGTRLVISQHLLHRHPKYWDDPETFRPERWLNVPDAETERRRFCFLPFSAGGRNCIGQRFAMLEAQLIVAPIVRTFQVQVAPSQRETNFTLTNIVTMKTKPSLKIVVRERSP